MRVRSQTRSELFSAAAALKETSEAVVVMAEHSVIIVSDSGNKHQLSCFSASEADEFCSA